MEIGAESYEKWEGVIKRNGLKASSDVSCYVLEVWGRIISQITGRS